MRIALVLVPALVCVGVAVSCGKDKKDNPQGVALPAAASEYSKRVVPADFANTKTGLSGVVSSLEAQLGSMKGPGEHIGLQHSTSPNRVVASLTDSHFFSRAARSMMLNASAPTAPSSANPPFPPTADPGFPFPPSSDSKFGGCDGFFENVDQQIGEMLQGLKTNLGKIKEDEVLKIDGVTLGQKQANEAFRYNVAVSEKDGEAKGWVAGGANETAAFLKAAGSFKTSVGLNKTQGEGLLPRGENSNRGPNREPNRGSIGGTDGEPSAESSDEVVIDSGLVDASVLVDGQALLARLGGGVAVSGRSKSGPVRLRAATFYELAGGKTPGMSLELQADGSGKFDENAPAMDGGVNLKFSLRQVEASNFVAEVNGEAGVSDGKNPQKFSMNLSAQFGVVNGECKIKSISCKAVPASVCNEVNSWKAN